MDFIKTKIKNHYNSKYAITRLCNINFRLDYAVI